MKFLINVKKKFLIRSFQNKTKKVSIIEKMYL